MTPSPASVLAHFAARYPHASEERVAALTVLHYERLRGKPVRPAPPKEVAFAEHPMDTWLRQLKAVAGPEYAVTRALLMLIPSKRRVDRGSVDSAN